MSSKKESGSLKKAEVSPAVGPQPKASNAMGRITPKTSPPPSKKAPTNPKDKGYQDELLDWGESLTSPDQIKDQWGQLQQAKTAAQKAGDSLGATAAKDALMVLQDKAKQMGMSGKDLPGVAEPLLDILGALGGGGRKGGQKRPAASKTETKKPANTAPAQNTPPENGKPDKQGGQTPGKARNVNGNCGESLARKDLEDEGYEVTSVQNKSGHGIDVVGRHPQTGDVRVLEVKTTVTDTAPPLTGAGKEMGGEKFVEDRLSKAAKGLGHYKNQPEVEAAAKKVQKWLKEAKQRNAKVEYKKHDVFVDDPEKGCIKRKASQSSNWEQKPKQPRAKK